MRALARLSEQKFIQDKVQAFRTEHEDWKDLVAYLMTKHTSRDFKKKKTKEKVKKVETNVKASETLIHTYLGGKLQGKDLDDTEIDKEANTEKIDSGFDNSSEQEDGASDGEANLGDALKTIAMSKKKVEGDKKAKGVRNNLGGLNVAIGKGGNRLKIQGKTSEIEIDRFKPSQITNKVMETTYNDSDESSEESSIDDGEVKVKVPSNYSKSENVDDNSDDESDDAEELDDDNDDDDDEIDNMEEMDDDNEGDDDVVDKEDSEKNSEDGFEDNKIKNKKKLNAAKSKRRNVAFDVKLPMKTAAKEKLEGEVVIKKLNLSEDVSIPSILSTENKKIEKSWKKYKDPFFDCGNNDDETGENGDQFEEDIAEHDEEETLENIESNYRDKSNRNVHHALNAFTTTFVGSLKSEDMMHCNDRQFKTNQEWKKMRQEQKQGDEIGR